MPPGRTRAALSRRASSSGVRPDEKAIGRLLIPYWRRGAQGREPRWRRVQNAPFFRYVEAAGLTARGSFVTASVSLALTGPLPSARPARGRTPCAVIPLPLTIPPTCQYHPRRWLACSPCMAPALLPRSPRAVHRGPPASLPRSPQGERDDDASPPRPARIRARRGRDPRLGGAGARRDGDVELQRDRQR